MGMYTVLAAAAVLMAQGSLALAENPIEWVGGTEGSWDEPTNWSLGLVPSLGDDVSFDVGDMATGVDVVVSESSLYCSLHIESGDVSFAMGVDASLISLQGNEGCDARHPKLSIAGANQDASLTVIGGVLTDGLDHDTVEIQIGSGESAVGTLVLTGGVQAEPWTVSQSDSVIMLGDVHLAFGELIIESSVDLRAFEIHGYDDRHQGLDRASIRFVSGYDVQVRSVSDVGHILIGSDGTLDCEDIVGGHVVVGTDGVVRCNTLVPDELVLAGGVEVLAGGVYASPILVDEAGVVISAAAISAFSLIQMDIASLIEDGEPMLTLRDITTSGVVSVHVGGSSIPESGGGLEVYPEVGSVLPLADFEHFFERSASYRRAGASGDLERHSFYLSLYEEYDWGAVTYFVVNSEERASLLVGQAMMRRSDLNFDGVVDFFDIPVFMEFYLQGSPWANIDGVNGVGQDDINAFLNGF